MSTVLVTGGSGFVGSHCILQLLAAGHRVHTTVRDLGREAGVRALLAQQGAEPGERLAFFAADLSRDEGWAEAVRGCEYVLHVASPFPPRAPVHEDELVIPAREGALRVLRASREAGVKRVVLTSSFAAIGYGHAPRDTPFDERSWTNLEGPGITAYVKSKTLAERAAWDFIAREGGGLELSVINPVGIFGPVLGSDYASSIAIIQQMLAGAMPAVPRLSFGVVDVRDVADLHLRAMIHPDAGGERFLGIAEDALSMLEVARVLRRRLGAEARRVPRFQLPDWVVRVAARLRPELREAVLELGKRKRITNEKARRVLGWTPRSSEDAIVATGESLVRLGLVRPGAQTR